MSASAFVALSATIALSLYGMALLLVAIRLMCGPTLPDRVLALDMMVAIGVGFIAAFSLASRQSAYLDIAVALGLVGFLSTVAFARYIETRRRGTGGPAGSNADD